MDHRSIFCQEDRYSQNVVSKQPLPKLKKIATRRYAKTAINPEKEDGPSTSRDQTLSLNQTYSLSPSCSLNQTPLNHTTLNQTHSLNQSHSLNQTPSNRKDSLSQSHSQNQTPLNKTPLNQTPLNQTTLNQTPSLKQSHSLNQTRLNRKHSLSQSHAQNQTLLLNQKSLKQTPLSPEPLNQSHSLNQKPLQTHVPSSDECLSSDPVIHHHSHVSSSKATTDDDYGYQDLTSPNINKSLDALEVSIIGYTNQKYDSVGDLFMMHKPRRNRCSLVSHKLNLERLWARSMFTSHQIESSQSVKQYRSKVFLQRNVCKKKFAEYMKSMKSTCKSKSSERPHATTRTKKTKSSKHKKIKLDIENEKSDSDGVVQIWRRKEPVKQVNSRRKSVKSPRKKIMSRTLRSSSESEARPSGSERNKYTVPKPRRSSVGVDKPNKTVEKSPKKSVGVCLPRKKITKTKKAEETDENESVSGVFKSLFSSYSNLGLHCGAVWKKIVNEDNKFK